jgi:hypothetical protein
MRTTTMLGVIFVLLGLIGCSAVGTPSDNQVINAIWPNFPSSYSPYDGEDDEIRNVEIHRKLICPEISMNGQLRGWTRA